MTRRRTLLLVVLVYIGLDLCLPAMPGAFVFEPAQSVDGIGRSHFRLAAEAVVAPAPGADLRLPVPLPDDLRRLPPGSTTVAVDRRPPVRRQPTARRDTARSSEDPH